MSSILKALQKLERDKDIRRTREPDISTAVKMSSIPGNRHTNRWVVPALVVVVAMISILVTFAIMGGFSASRKTALQPVPQPARTSQPAAAGDQPVQPTDVFDSRIPVTASDANLAAPAAKPTPSQTRRASIPTLPSSPTEAKSPAAMPPSIETAPTAQPPTPQPEEADPGSKIKISGIAWQKDSAARIAVVNGSAVSEGGNVAGVKVEQIFPNKVRFSQGGKSFEVSLDHEGQ
ncbi:hypothetical protein OR1_01662 [Geobacter sp. OR-1]|uniref:general secretion pathway protein GspB n=1 Tax=Geobacter sp. OR-1 TaxID=1266765 RepID=UPI00054353B1|nr:general secretion pathway protein GspB [Geobacter sp. OR-1]GAM09384.1 hypothetical protein OR1_01662 [Geobacter sp. OR-1]